jgi:tetratricopeptide (TPR) repeat protein
MEALATLAEDLFERARPFGQSEFIAPATLLLAEFRRSRGDDDGARAALGTFMESTEPSPNFRALFMPVAVRSMVALGDIDGAEKMIPDHSDASTARHRVSLLTARAVVAEARGDLEGALDGYREAAELWGTHGFRLELGLTLTGAGRCLLQLGRREEAIQALAGSREVLTPLRAAPALSEIDELLGDESEQLGSA